MEKIKTDIKKLVDFISRAFVEKEEIETVKGNCEISVETYWKPAAFNGEKQVVLYSLVRNITLPNAALYPQLRSLYGVPVGLLTVADNAQIAKTKSTKVKDDAATQGNMLIRRALLYASVWYLKSLKTFQSEDLYVPGDFVRALLQNPADFLPTIARELLQYPNFPEDKPDKVSLSNTHYDYACLWFAHRIGDHFFGGQKMPQECKDWFIALRSLTLKAEQPTPEVFAQNFAAIVAYVVAQKAVSQEDCSAQNILALATPLCADSNKLQMVLFNALFYIGLYHSAADRYYFTSNANALMTVLEKSAYLFAQGINEDLQADWNEAFQRIKSIESKQNCITYYQTKYPALNGRSAYDYELEPRAKKAEEIAMLPPELCDKFMSESGRMIDIPQKIQNDSIFLLDEVFSSEFQKFKFPYISKKGNGKLAIALPNYDPNQPMEIVSMDSPTEVSKNLQRFNIDKVTPIVNPESKVWIVQITSALGLTTFAQSVMIQAYTKAQPELILVVYHCDGQPANSRRKKKTDEEPATPNYGMMVAQLQRTLESLFPERNIAIIAHHPSQPMWESVRMGELILEQYDFSDISIIELRSSRDRKEHPSLLPRMIRDVIVYDEQQKYLFMNLE